MLAELATALRGVGKHAEAVRCCNAAVRTRPDYQRGWLELGRCQAAQGGFHVVASLFCCTLVTVLSGLLDVLCTLSLLTLLLIVLLYAYCAWYV